MQLLALDIGSSAVKAAVLRDARIAGGPVRSEFPTRVAGARVEVDPEAILSAIAGAVHRLGAPARRVEAIAMANMAPSWIAMDRRGRPVTAVITHQDRRSVEIAQELEQRVGRQRHLELAGNRPFPGGISSTTFAWHLRHEPARMRRAALVGHLNTFIHRQWTGARVTDPSNASFMGLYRTTELSGWCDELIDAIGAHREMLPEVRPADEIGGTLNSEGAQRLGLPAGLPVLVGLVDTSAAMLLAPARVGQLVNVCGATDVLALCTDRPHPHERLLTRALGIGRRWLEVSTIAAAGSSLDWMRNQFFSDLSPRRMDALLARISRRPQPGSVRFEPYLAGDRMSIEQRQGAFTGLTLATTREEMLSAVVEALAAASAARLPLLRQCGVHIRRRVLVSGGVQSRLQEILYRDWPGGWEFHAETEATLRGLARLME